MSSFITETRRVSPNFGGLKALVQQVLALVTSMFATLTAVSESLGNNFFLMSGKLASVEGQLNKLHEEVLRLQLENRKYLKDVLNLAMKSEDRHLALEAEKAQWAQTWSADAPGWGDEPHDETGGAGGNVTPMEGVIEGLEVELLNFDNVVPETTMSN